MIAKAELLARFVSMISVKKMPSHWAGVDRTKTAFGLLALALCSNSRHLSEKNKKMNRAQRLDFCF